VFSVFAFALNCAVSNGSFHLYWIKSVYCLMVQMHVTERPIFWGRLLGCGLLLLCLLNIN